MEINSDSNVNLFNNSIADDLIKAMDSDEFCIHAIQKKELQLEFDKSMRIFLENKRAEMTFILNENKRLTENEAKLKSELCLLKEKLFTYENLNNRDISKGSEDEQVCFFTY